MGFLDEVGRGGIFIELILQRGLTFSSWIIVSSVSPQECKKNNRVVRWRLVQAPRWLCEVDGEEYAAVFFLMRHADQLAANLGDHLDVLLKRPLAGWNCDSKWCWACLDQLVHVASFGQNCEDTAVLCHVAWRWPRRTTLYLFSSSVLSAGLLHEFGMDSALCHFDVLSRIHRRCKTGRRQHNRL